MRVSVSLSKYTNWEFVGRADSQVVTSVICNRSHPDPLGIVLWYANLEFAEGSQGVEQHCHLRTSAPASVGISIEFRAIYRHPFVGDGFPVPRNSETCMGRDGKPVPYDAFTVGPTNSNLRTTERYRAGGAARSESKS